MQNWWLIVAMTWNRRHPIWTTLLVLVFGFLYAVAIAGEETAGSIVVVTLFLLVVVGIIFALSGIAGWWHRWRTRTKAPSQSFPIVSSPNGSTRSQTAVPVELASPASTTYPVSLGLGDMLTMTPLEFEQLSTRVLLALGYEDVRLSGGSGDLNADIVAKDSFGRSVIVQCKRYAPGSTVGTPTLQTFIGMVHIHHRADRGIFMTTAHYSQPAIEFGLKHNIVLIDGSFLVDLLDLANIR